MDSLSYQLTERHQRVLMAVIRSFVEGAEPVGSRTLSRSHLRELSPATIRNVMADLEEMGYLDQPHPSAGRVPTEKAYRLYVNSLGPLPVVSRADTDRIRKGYPKRVRSVGELMDSTSKVLSTMTRQASLVFLSNLSKTVFKQVRFIKRHPFRALVVLVSQGGLVEHKAIQLDEDLSQDYLDKVATYLNEEYSGMSLRQVRQKIYLRMEEQKRQFDVLYREALKLSQKAFLEDEGEEEDTIYLGGASHILTQPEFKADVGKMRALFETFEEKSRLMAILDKCLASRGMTVLIGSENEIASMEDCALIARTYGDEEALLGTLGVVGPKRMEYPRIMALVDHTARTLSHLLAVSAF